MKTTEPTVKTALRGSTVVIKVNWKGTRAHESTGVKMTEKEFKSGLWKRTPSIRKRLNEIDTRITELMSSRKHFTASDCLGKTSTGHTIDWILSDMVSVKRLEPNTVDNYRTSITSLRKYFGDFQLEDLSLDEIKGYARTVKVEPSTMCGYLKCLKSLLNYAASRGYIRENVMKDWKYRGDGYKDRDKPRSRTRAEVTILINRFNTEKDRLMKESIGTWLAAYYFCGLGLTDLTLVDWDGIEMELIGGRWYYKLSIFRKKTKELASIMTPVIPLTQNLVELMKTRPWSRYSSVKNFNQYTNNRLKKVFPDLTYYQARHTFCSMLVASGTPLNTISSMMGRSVSGISAYIERITESSALAKAADSIRLTEIPETPPEDIFLD